MAAVDLEQEGPVQIHPIMRFSEAGLHPAMMKNIEMSLYQVPTPIQKYCLPAISRGHDVIGIAQTGKIFSHRCALEPKVDTAPRFGKDRRLSHSHSEQAHGKSEEACRGPSQPGYVSAWYRSTCSCRASCLHRGSHT